MDLESAACFLFTPESGHIIHVFRSRDVTSVIQESAKRLGYQVFHVAGSAVRDKDTLLNALSQTMSFPDYFGHNWDSLEECLKDLQWLPSPGYVILFEEVDRLMDTSPETFATFLEIVIAAAKQWASFHVAFRLVLPHGNMLPTFLEKHGIANHYVWFYDDP